MDLGILLQEAIQKHPVGDVQMWLSASLTNQEMCIGALEGLNRSVKSTLFDQVLHISKLLRHSLAIIKNNEGEKQRSCVVNNHPGLLVDFKPRGYVEADGFPTWLSSDDRRLLRAIPCSVKAYVVIAQDGSGNYSTIGEAVNMASSKSGWRFIIHVKAGTYAEEEVVVSKENIIMMGNKNISRSVDPLEKKRRLTANQVQFLERSVEIEN